MYDVSLICFKIFMSNFEPSLGIICNVSVGRCFQMHVCMYVCVCVCTLHIHIYRYRYNVLRIDINCV